MKLCNIPASVILAQAMLESGNGSSNLATSANNHFGIKCHKEWRGPTFTMDDDEKDECFRKYESVVDSYSDHSLFLCSRKWYAFLFTLPKNDYVAWAKGLKQAGYATHPAYAELLIEIIEKNRLYELDTMESIPPVVTEEEKNKAYTGVTYETKRLIDVICTLDLNKIKDDRLETGFDTLYNGYLNWMQVITSEGSGSGFDPGYELALKTAFVQEDNTIKNIMRTDLKYSHHERIISDIYKNCGSQFLNNEVLTSEKITYSFCKNPATEKAIPPLNYISHLKDAYPRLETVELINAPKTFKEDYFFPGKNKLGDLSTIIWDWRLKS